MLSTVDSQQTTAHRSKLQLLFSLGTRVNGLTIESKKAYFEWNRLFLIRFFCGIIGLIYPYGEKSGL